MEAENYPKLRASNSQQRLRNWRETRDTTPKRK